MRPPGSLAAMAAISCSVHGTTGSSAKPCQCSRASIADWMCLAFMNASRVGYSILDSDSDVAVRLARRDPRGVRHEPEARARLARWLRSSLRQRRDVLEQDAAVLRADLAVEAAQEVEADQTVAGVSVGEVEDVDREAGHRKAQRREPRHP